jgi:hypothetical protein
MQMKSLNEQAFHLANHVGVQLTPNQSSMPTQTLLMKTHLYNIALLVLFGIPLSRDLTSPMRYNKYVILFMTQRMITCRLFQYYIDKINIKIKFTLKNKSITLKFKFKYTLNKTKLLKKKDKIGLRFRLNLTYF